jgi:hypothetical protein
MSGADRTTKTSPEESRTRFAALASARNKSLYGYVDLGVEHLRQVQAQQNAGSQPVRAIGVYDTAIAGNASHAEAFLVVKFSNKRPLQTVETDLLDRYKDHAKKYEIEPV